MSFKVDWKMRTVKNLDTNEIATFDRGAEELIHVMAIYNPQELLKRLKWSKEKQ